MRGPLEKEQEISRAQRKIMAGVGLSLVRDAATQSPRHISGKERIDSQRQSRPDDDAKLFLAVKVNVVIVVVCCSLSVLSETQTDSKPLSSPASTKHARALGAASTAVHAEQN